MRNRREDLRNILLIAGAGAVGVLGTVFVTKATEAPATSPVEARQQAVVEIPERLSELSERVRDARRITVKGTVSTTGEGSSIRIFAPGGEASRELMESPLVAGQPVVYVDGVRIDGSRDEALKLVEPDQIDRIEVIKGDAARRQFGSEARNGVIQIYLKPGETPSKKDDDGR